MYNASKDPTKAYKEIPIIQTFDEPDIDDNVRQAANRIMQEYLKSIKAKKAPEAISVCGYSRGGIQAVLLAKKFEMLNRIIQNGPKAHTTGIGKDPYESFVHRSLNKFADINGIKWAQVQAYNKQDPLKIKFMGLIDPCGTNSGRLLTSRDVKDIPSLVQTLWLGTKDGKWDFVMNGGLNKVQAKAAMISEKFTPTYEFKTLPADTTKVSYTQCHGGFTYSTQALDDLLKAARKAGLRFDMPMKKVTVHGLKVCI